MPYIPQKDRPELDKHIDALAEEIKKKTKESGNEAGFAGLLNYSVTRLILKIIPAKRYWVIALVTGVLKNISQEFYRRFAGPYEDEQIKKNGDVYEK